MRHTTLLLLAALSGLACGQSGEPLPADETGQVEAFAVTAVFQGKVLDTSGAPILGARVTVNGITRLTSSTGSYSLSVSGSETGYVFDVRKDGYGPVNEFRKLGRLGAEHRLVKGFTRELSATVNNTIRDPASGISVALPANSLRTATGNPVGLVRFSIVPHNPRAMPGDFTARNAQGQLVALESVGAVTLAAVDSQGTTLGLVKGAAMDVRLPVPASIGGTMPPCVLEQRCRAAIWRFDPRRSLWNELIVERLFETTATRFQIRGAETLTAGDGLGTWNADIEFTTAACTIIELVGFPSECHNTTPSTSPEPGFTLTFSQLGGGGSKAVYSSESFVELHNLKPYEALTLSVLFPPTAPAGCANNLSFSQALPSFPFPPTSVNANSITYDSAAPALTPGPPMKLDAPTIPIDITDVVDYTAPNHSCSTHVQIFTQL